MRCLAPAARACAAVFLTWHRLYPRPTTPSQLAHAIAENKGLVTLDLGGNNIGPEGVKALAGALRGHGALRSLEMGYNPLGPEGTKTLVEVVMHDLKVGARVCALSGCLAGGWGGGACAHVRWCSHVCGSGG